MTIIQSLILGIVQGLTEFLPISSSGHLIVVPYFLGWAKHDRAFDAMLHLGTMLAILFFFRKEIIAMLMSVRNDINIMSKNRFMSIKNRESIFKTIDYFSDYTKLFFTIGIISLPVFIAGLLLDNIIEELFSDAFTVALFMLFATIIMFFADNYAKELVKENNLNVSENSNNDGARISFLKSLFISCSQIAAMFPGVSRSGITISTAMFLGVKKEIAAKFTFLMSIPVILGAGLYKLKDLSIDQNSISVNIIGLLASFIFGVLAIKIMLSILSKSGFKYFIIYRILLIIAIFMYYFWQKY